MREGKGCLADTESVLLLPPSHTNTHARRDAHAHTDADTGTHTHTTRARTHTHTIHTRKHTRTRTHTHTHTHTRRHIHKHTYTDTHADRQTPLPTVPTTTKSGHTQTTTTARKRTHAPLPPPPPKHTLTHDARRTTCQLGNLLAVGVVYLVLIGSSMEILAPLGLEAAWLPLADRRMWTAVATVAVLPTVHLGGCVPLSCRPPVR